MRKILAGMMLISTFLLAGCGDKDSTIEELEAIEEKSVPIELADVLDNKVEIGTMVQITGEVTEVIESQNSFTVTTKENDGVIVKYTIKNLVNGTFYVEDELDVYGVYKGQDDAGFILIDANGIKRHLN